MVVAVALTGEEHVFAVLEEGPGIGYFNIGAVFFHIEGADLSGCGVGQQELHFVLKAVHTHHGEGVGVLGPLHAGHVLVVLAADVEFEGFLRFEVVDHDIDHRVVLAGFGIFVCIVFGIEFAPHLHGVLFHFAFVEAVESNLFAVGRPVETFGDGEFFFVDPVGGAVDDVVELAVEGDLCFFLRAEGHDEKVVVAHVGNHLSVGGEGGEPLFAFFGEAVDVAVGNVVEVV